MANVSPKRFVKWLQIRADDELIQALDEIRLASDPTPSRSDVVRKLIHDRRKRLKGKDAQ